MEKLYIELGIEKVTGILYWINIYHTKEDSIRFDYRYKKLFNSFIDMMYKHDISATERNFYICKWIEKNFYINGLVCGKDFVPNIEVITTDI